MLKLVSTKLEKIFPKKGKYAYLAGAGISRDPPSNLPSAREITKALINFYFPKEEIPQILKMDNIKFELIAELIKLYVDPNLKCMEYIERNRDSNLIHYFLAEAIKKRQIVLTTNFDYLIENALCDSLSKEDRTKIKVIITREDFLNCTKPEKLMNKGKLFLFKIHGSNQNIITGQNTKDSLIITIGALGRIKKKEFQCVFQSLFLNSAGTYSPIVIRDASVQETTFELEDFKENVFLKVLKDKILIILGYSGKDTFDITPELKKLDTFSKLIWIKHDNAIKDNSIKIFIPNKKYLNHKYINKLEKYNEDRLFFELALRAKKKGKSPSFYLVRTNTNLFVEHFLWTHFKIDRAKPVLEEYSNPEDYSSWADKELEINNPTNKYILSFELFRRLGLISRAFKVAKKGLNISEQTNNKKQKVDFLNYLGWLYQQENNIDKMGAYFQAAFTLAKRIKSKVKKVECLNNMGEFCYYSGKTKRAENFFQKALAMAEQLNNKRLEIQTLINMGILYINTNRASSSLLAYNKALYLSEIHGDVYNKIQSNICIGNYWNIFFRGSHKTWHHYIIAKNICEESNYLFFLPSLYISLGGYCMSEYNKALKLFNKAINISRSSGSPYREIKILYSLAMLHKYQGKKIEGKKFLKEALKKAKAENHMKFIKKIKEAFSTYDEEPVSWF